MADQSGKIGTVNVEEYLGHLESMSVKELVRQGVLSAKVPDRSEKLIEYEMWRREFAIAQIGADATAVIGVAGAMVAISIYGVSFPSFSFGWFFALALDVMVTAAGLAVLRSMNVYLSGDKPRKWHVW